MLFDLLGAAISLLSTYYFIHQNEKAWPIGMLATCLNAILYWQSGIYADMCLEWFYFLSSGYGWLRWSQHKSSMTSVPIKNVSIKQGVVLCIAFVILFTVIVFLLTQYTTSTVAKTDGFTTAMSLIAQGLMSHKFIATWILWFITDATYAYLYLHKQLPFHALLMLVYTGMAVAGFLIWKREIKG